MINKILKNNRFFLNKLARVFNISSRKRKIIFSLLLVLFIIAPLSFIFFNKQAEASWWDESWFYRKSISVTNNIATENNVYITLSLDTSETAKFQADCGDIRFVRANGEILPYFIVSGCGTNDTILHVNFAVFDAGTQTIDFYYGNPTTDNGFSNADFATQATNYTIGAIASEEKSPAPVLYLPFNEGYGNIAHDESSNKNNGTINGATWKNESECVSGKCLYFRGVDDYRDNVNYGNIFNEDDIKHEMTISVWLKTDTLSQSDWNRGIFISKSQYSVDNSAWEMYVNESGVNWTIRNDSNSGYTQTTTFSLNKWNHLVGTWDNGEQKFYLNGTLVSSNIRNFTKINDSSSNVYVGLSDNTVNHWFKGFIDEPKIYNYARTANQIKQDYNAGLAGVSTSDGTGVSIGSSSNKDLSDGLVGYWKMDEASWSGTAGEVKDASGNNNHGTVATGVTKDSGKFGDGGNFNASSEYINVGNSSSLNLTSQSTISLWYKPNYSSCPARYIDIIGRRGTGTNYEIYQQIGTCKLGFFNGNAITPFNFIPSTNTWVNIIVTSTATESKLYINGKYQESIAFGLGSGGVSDVTKIGSVINGEYPEATIDEVRIYNRALSSNEIEKLYEYAPGPIAYWNLDEKNGNIINDKSGNNYFGSLGLDSGTPNWATGKFGSGLDFGSGKYADVSLGSRSSNFSTNVSGRSFSYSMWFKSSSVSSNQYLLTNNSACNNYGNFAIRLNGGNISFNYYGNPEGGSNHSFTPSTPLKNNQWYHLEWTKTFGQLGVKAYVNGIPQIVSGDSANLGSSALDDIILGAFNGDGTTCTLGVDNVSPIVSQNLKGSLDDVKIYNYIRTQKQILEDMNGNRHMGILPMEYWNFNGTLNSNLSPGSTATIFDDINAPFSNDGKFGKSLDFSILDSGNFTWVNDNTLRDSTKNWAINKWAGYQFAQNYNFTKSQYCKDTIDSNTATDIIFSSTCSYFSGSLGYIIKKAIYAIGPMPSQPTNQITSSLWFKSNGLQSARIVRASNESVGLTIGNDFVGGFALHFSNGISYATNPHDGNWHYLAISWDGFIQKLYYDGKIVSNSSLTGSMSQINKYLIVGSRNDGNNEYFNGLIDEIKIYPYALSNEEIKNDYNQNSAMLMGDDESRNNNGTEVSGANKDYCIPGDSAKCDSPVAEWKFDEKTGTTAYDTSGNGNNGTLVNSPIWDVGKNGSALNFNSSAKRVTIGTPVGESGYATASLWYKRSEKDSSTSWRTLLGHASANIHHLISQSTSRSLGIWDGQFRDFGYNPPNDGKWHKYDVIYNSGVDATLYVDGVYKNKITTTLNLSTNPIGSIGNWGVGSYWAGPIDQVQIYNYARTPAQIAWDYNRGKPIAHWKMDEGEGIAVHDESGNGNHGIMTNMDPATDWVEGRINNSLYFDGVNDYVNTNLDVQPSIMPTTTWTAWVKPSLISGNRMVFTNDNGGYDRGVESSRGGDGRFNIFTGTNSWAPVVADFNQWQHIAVVYALDNIYFYKNGVQYLYGSAATGQVTTNYFRIGSTAVGEYFDGQIDEVKIYNYALTPEQVKQDYNGGAINFK